ncbi:MAG TPA: hypothetical protein VIM13_00080 [Clostridia bacterium]
MKRILIVIMSLVLVMSVLAGCGKGTAETPGGETPGKQTPGEQTPGGETPGGGNAAAGDLKTGFAVITSVAKSADAGDKEGVAQVDSTVAAVTVDAQGKIVNAVFDAVQTKINFTAEGRITTPLDTKVRTKQELKTEYGMIKASGIGKEWNEQADAFAEYVKGKTIAEVKGIALNESGAPADAELSSSVTMHVTDLIAVLEKAVNNAQALGAKSGDKLGLGIVTTIDKSANATADKDGVAQAYSTYAAATFGADGKITSSIIDASQSNVNFNASGKITTDLQNADLRTKNELGDQYGMRKASGIGKEWNEQAAAFAEYVKGKTVSEVKGISLNEEGAPAEAELASSVTVHVTDFISILEKASQNAK